MKYSKLKQKILVWSFILLTLFFFFPLSQTILLFVLIYLVWYFALELGKESSSDLQTIIFLFSLTITITFFAVIFAIKHGAIYDHGHITPLVKMVLEYVLNLNASIIFFVTLWSIFVMPQVFSLILSGILGYASKLKHIDTSLSIFSWGIIKSTVTASALLITLYAFNLFLNWVDIAKSTLVLVISLLLLLSTFIFAVFHRMIIKKVVEKINYNSLKKIKTWMRRNIKDEENLTIDTSTFVMDIIHVLNKHDIDLSVLIEEVIRNKKTIH